MAHKIFTSEAVTVYRLNRNDVNGNPRCCVHFLDFLTEEEKKLPVLEAYELAIKKARKHGARSWRRYSCREFGGGLTCQYDYCNGHEIAADVRHIQSINY